MIDEIKNEELIEPRADSLLESARSYGYDLKTALSDIVDNSISAGSKNIWILQRWDVHQSVIAILDDGNGMSEDILREAMRLGSVSPSKIRESGDLGRFGLGMKTASLSQCRRVTVSSKVSNQINTRCWDIDYVKKTERWSLQTNHDENSLQFVNRLNDLSSGTVVIWQNLDRILSNQISDDDNFDPKSEFFKKLDESRQYISMIFHRFLSGSKKINIFITSIDEKNLKSGLINPWDPYARQYNSFNPIDPEQFELEESTVSVTPWVLPHKSKYPLTEDFYTAGGPYGWNAHQGFYLYREKRLIIFGSWFNLGYKKEDHYKLCRISIDIDNSLDHLWKIDVKKSSAEIPDSLKKNLKRIAMRSREMAASIYRNRGEQVRRSTPMADDFVWLKKNQSGVHRYNINRNHIILKKYIEEIGISNSLKDLLKLIEKTVPVEQIIMTNSENPDSHVQIGKTSDGDFKKFVPLFITIFKEYLNYGYDKDEAFNKTLSKEPFFYYSKEFGALKDEL